MERIAVNCGELQSEKREVLLVSFSDFAHFVFAIIQGQENAYKEVIKTAVGGAAGVIHAVDSATTDCQPNENVEALRVFMLGKKIECRPVWKPMHKQPVYEDAPVYTNGIEEELFKVGFCLPAGPYVTDDDVKYIVESIKEAIVR